LITAGEERNSMMKKGIGPALNSLLFAALLLPATRSFAATGVEELLEKAGRNVEAVWQQVASFTCTESVIQEKVGRGEKVELKIDSLFDYLALPRAQEDMLTAEELRLPKKGAKEKPNKPAVLATNGFPTLLLIFHPRNQPDYRYRIESEIAEDGKWIRVHFEHIAGSRSTCALALREKIYPLELQGTAWIDAETGIIQKIRAGLITPLKDINIKAFNAEVIYSPQSFSPDPEMQWLPASAIIDLQTELQHWRNIHQFTQYKRFTVQSLESNLR
jgi:hypothetical protein